MNAPGLKPAVWPAEGHGRDLAGRWLHSDIKNVAYPYVRLVFESIVREGNLK